MVMGVFSDRGIKELISKKVITSNSEIVEKQIQPSSIDLSLGDTCFCLPYSSIPGATNLERHFSEIKDYSIDSSKGVHLHKDKVYVFRLNEILDLSKNETTISGRANPKSSTGRTDIQVRLITQGGKEFDNVPSKYSGELWLEVIPRSFDIYLKSGVSLNQLRLFDRNSSPLSYEHLEAIHEEEGLIFKNGKKLKLNLSLERKLIQVSVDLSRKIGAYVARTDCNSTVDLTKKENNAADFFREIYTKDKSIILTPNSFYILSSAEEVNIPLDCCAEMGDIQTSIGEFRAHYAGFFDPGFNAKAVLEVRNLGAPFKLSHGQNIASMIYYLLKNKSSVPYGECGSNYQSQSRLKLAKFFSN